MKRSRFSRKPYRFKPKESIFKKPLFWFFILIIFFAAAAAYILFFWKYFQIKNIVIYGNQEVQTEYLEKLASDGTMKRILFFDTKSIFLLSPACITETILKNFPEIDSANTEKKFPDTVTVDIKERQPFAIICGFKDDPEDLCFLMDEKGFIFKETSIEDSNLILIRQYEEKQAQLGTEIVDSHIIAGISKIKQNFQNNFNLLNAVRAEIVSAERLNVVTNEGWKIYFNLSSDISLQITKLNLLLEKSFPKTENRTKLNYIDLRFENKAYYK